MELKLIKKWFKYNHPEWVFIYHLVRLEIQLSLLDVKIFFSPRQRKLSKYYQSRSNIKLHIACGKNIKKGWLNVDLGPSADFQFNLRRKFPLKSSSVKYIFTEHFLDHLQRPEPIRHVLLECCRVLKKGGVMRIL